MGLIPEEDVVAWGGSETLVETGMLDIVSERNKVIDRELAQSPEERIQLMREALLCDTYLTSVNAISEDGQLFFTDGVGNRAAAIIFGPKSVIVLAAMKKVCPTVEDAETRVQNLVAPLNVQRLDITDTICGVTGSCGLCKTPSSVCSHVVRTRLCKPAGRIKVILIGEDAGY